MTELFPLTVVKDDFSRVHKMLYGFPKAGKTTFCSHMLSSDGKKPLFIMSEAGHGTLQLHHVRVSTWEEFCRLVDETLVRNVAEIQRRFSCIVVDHLTDLDDWSAAYTCNKHSVSYLGDLPHGKGWSEHGNEIKKYLAKLFTILPITFIAHAKDKTVKVDGKDVNIQVPSLTNKTLQYVNEKVDCIMFIIPAPHGKRPRLTMIPSLTCIAGSRYQYLCKDYEFDIANVGKTYQTIQKTFKGEEEAK